MKETPLDYSRAQIYLLKCLTTGKQYVGHTTQSLSQRLDAHRYSYKHWKKTGKKWMTSFDILEGGNYEITLLETYPCNTSDELTARERFWIESMDHVNRVIPIRTDEEWKEYFQVYYQANADKVKERMMKYYQANRDQIKEKIKEKFECPCGGRHTRGDKAKHGRTQKHQKWLTTQK